MTAIDPSAARKARGAFFTPPELCRYVVDWALRGPSDVLLEPSCGEAAFLVAAARRLAELGGRADERQLHGVEMHAASASGARTRLASAARPRRSGSPTSSPSTRRHAMTRWSATRRTCAIRTSPARHGYGHRPPLCELACH
ncbi:N-6 DNA methylase [Fodinicola feengrottensis]|uniref:N-6 DNA methylase n=1 Tax=Fodinicola feengrottensis TaxID=435914 RepID=UPI0028BD9FDA|nr:N-6 DNA methylase [Fodinicola feengrottensis]